MNKTSRTYRSWAGSTVWIGNIEDALRFAVWRAEVREKKQRVSVLAPRTPWVWRSTQFLIEDALWP